jgi:hypothetical protein
LPIFSVLAELQKEAQEWTLWECEVTALEADPNKNLFLVNINIC